MKKLIFYILLIFFTLHTNAQVKENLKIPQNPKIGLSLSGGGAKGFAHVGVLKVLDSLGVKVDYISGTSMGAIVGGLYASGYTGKDIEKIRDVFEKVQVLFLKDDFVRECKKFGFTEEDIENILNDLYKLSAIGNHFKTVKYAKLKTIYRFSYRNDKSLYHDKAITVHKAIEKGLGLSDFKSSLLINDLTDEEKNKYGCQNSFTDYEDEFQISIADRIREQKF